MHGSFKERWLRRSIYKCVWVLFCQDDLQLARDMGEEVSIGLGDKLALVGLLHKILVALLVGEVDGILLGLELDAMAVHEVGG